MKEYHKIQTVFKRDMSSNGKIFEGVYSLPEFDYLKNNEWIFTEKVDGTNIRVMWNGSGVVFGGKTDNAQLPMPLIMKLQEMFDTTPKREIFKQLFNTAQDEPGSIVVCFYGEGYGARIQKGGGNYLKDGVSFVLFDIKVGDFWLERQNVEDIGMKLDVQTVPILGIGTLKEAVEMTRKGFHSQWGNFLAEGIVAKPRTELQTRRGHRIITKIKHRDFL